MSVSTISATDTDNNDNITMNTSTDIIESGTVNEDLELSETNDNLSKLGEINYTYSDNKSLNTKQANGDSETNQSTNETIEKVDPDISLTLDTTINAGQTITIKVSVPFNATGTIQFLLDNTTISDEITINDSLISYDYTVPTEYIDTTKTISVYYSGDENYNNATINEELVITDKYDVDIRVLDNVITPGTNATFVASIPEGVTGNIVFKINGKTISEKINITSRTIQFTYLIPDSYMSPTYTLSVVYSGDSTYGSKTVNSTLTLSRGTKKDPGLSLENYTVKYLSSTTFTLTMAANATGNVVFKLNGSTITPKISVSNGVVSYTFDSTGINPGTYRLQAVYSGSVEYENASIRSYLTIEKLTSKVVVSNITSKAGSVTTFKSRVQDELGNPVSNTVVVFKLNGNTIGNATTNATGHAFLNYTLPSSFNNVNYTINAITKETKTVESARQNATLTLTQLKTRVVLPTVEVAINDTATINANIVDSNNNNVLKGTVTYYINGVKYKTVNVTNGYALLTFVPDTNVATTFNITAVYTGYWKYADSSNSSGILNVTKLSTRTTTRAIQVKNGIEGVFSASVEDENNVPVNGGYVRFTLNGTVIGTAEVINGAANLTYTITDFPEGSYRLNGSYLGSDSYYTSYNLNYANVSALTTSISGQAVYVTVGNSVKINVTVLDQSGHYVTTGNVTFKINGTTIGTSSVKSGVASVTYTPPNNYSGLTLLYVVTYDANDFYGNATYINNITVSSLSTVYVSNNGSDSNSGSKSSPFKTIAYAVDHVATYGTINILAGTYYTSGIQINNSITINGSGSSTIIDGSSSGETIFSVISSNVLVKISNMIIRNGKSTDVRSAGAIYSLGRLNITNVQFIGNTATGNFSGGAIYSYGLLNLTNCQFTNNSVINDNAEGGALRLVNNTTNIENCAFTNNVAKGSNSTGGGAIYLQDGDLVINYTRFTSNKVHGATAVGGAIKGSYGNIVLTQCTISKNMVNASSDGLGAAIGSLGTGIYINDTNFTNNTAYGVASAGGGAIYIQYAALEANNTIFTSNYAKANITLGGAVYGYTAYSEFNNTEFNSNYDKGTSLGFGGAIYYYSGNLTLHKASFTNNYVMNCTSSIGGAIYAECNLTIDNCDFTSNKVTGVSLGGGAICNTGNLTMTNSNLVNNNASSFGDAITSSSSKNSVENNYWGSDSPVWDELFNGVTTPTNYSKTQIKH